LWLDPVEQHLTATESLAGALHPHSPLALGALHGSPDDHEALVDAYDTMAQDWRRWTLAQGDHYSACLGVGLRHAQHRLQGFRHVVELSAGQGAGTEVLVAAGLHVISVEPLESMLVALRRMDPGPTAIVRGRSDCLPFASHSIPALIGLNAVADASEMKRVLTRRGFVLWCYSFAEATPLYIPPDTLEDAFGATVTAQRVGPGMWCSMEMPS
jgi:hypothetical protein